MFAKLCAALCIVALRAHAEKHLGGVEVKIGDTVLAVDDSGYEVDGASVKPGHGINVADDVNTKSAKLGAAIGSKLAEAEKLATVENIKAQAAAAAAANLALQKQLDDYQRLEAAAAATKRDLETKIGEAGVVPPLVMGLTACDGSDDACTTRGTEEFNVMLKGETYADVDGLVHCTFKPPTGSPSLLKSAAMAKVTSVSGKASVVICASPKFNPSHVTSKTFKAEVGVMVGGKTFATVGSKVFEQKFAASAPVLVIDDKTEASCALATCLALSAGKLSFSAGRLDSSKTAKFDFIVSDPDSKYSDVTASIKYSGKLFKSVTIKKVKDNFDGTFHMQLVMVQVDKFSDIKDASMMTLTLADKLVSKSYPIPLDYIAVDGKSPGSAGDSCAHLMQVGQKTSGQYWVRYGGASKSMWCDQEMDGGGWALVSTQKPDGQLRSKGSVKAAVLGPNKAANQRVSQAWIKQFAAKGEYQVIAEENKGQDKAAGLLMMYKLPKGQELPLESGYMQRNKQFKWHIGAGKYWNANNNAHGAWYGVSCHGGDFKGLARNKRCTQRNDFSKTGGTNGDYKMDHSGTHSGTTRCISGTTQIGVGHYFRSCADAAKVGAKAKC